MTFDPDRADCQSELNDLKARARARALAVAVAEEYEREPRLIASGAVASMLREWIGYEHTEQEGQR